MNFEKYICSYPDFPKSGVVFWDFSPLLSAPIAFKHAIVRIRNHYLHKSITHILAIEAKGFTLGAALAYEMGLPMHLIRKPSLIPGNVNKALFKKEYGEGEYQCKTDSLKQGERVLIVYDILAAPGATLAAIELAEAQGAVVVGCAYIIELQYLAGRDALSTYDLFSLVKIQNKPMLGV